MYTIEPLYHLFKVSPKEALPYFESICKPALDRKIKTISSIILNEIDFEKIPDGSIKGWYLLRLGGYYREFGEYEKALKYFYMVIENCFGDKKLLASVKNNIGWVYLFHNPKKNINKAILNFIQSNNICNKENYIKIKGMNFNNLGIAYERTKNHNLAEKSYFDSLKITESHKDFNPLVAAMAHRNIGLIFDRKNDLGNALSEYEKALKLYDVSKSPQGIGESLYFISLIYKKQKKYNEALEKNKLAKKYLLITKYGHYLTECNILLFELLEKTKSKQNISPILFEILLTSLSVDWDYHQFTLFRFLQILRFLTINYSKIYALEVLNDVIKIWQSVEELNEIPLVDFVNKAIVDEIENFIYWKTFRSKKFHLINSKCKIISWEYCVLINNDTSNLVKCKKCD